MRVVEFKSIGHKTQNFQVFDEKKVVALLKSLIVVTSILLQASTSQSIVHTTFC